MALESGTYISSLNANNPVGATDPKSQGDDHLRLIKSTILNTFPNVTNAVTATHTELNFIDGATGVTGTGNTVRSASPTFTGTLAAAAITASSTIAATGAITALSFGGITSDNLLDGTAVEAIAGVWTFDAAVTFDAGVTFTTGNIVAGTIDADFGLVTATSYGGIVEDNLLDSAAAETITNDWTFSDNDLIRPVIVDYGVKHATAVVDTNAATCVYSTAQSYFVDLEPASGNVTITLSGGPVSGDYGEMNIRVEQDSEGSRGIVWAGGVFEWPNGAAPTMTPAANALDIYHFQTIDGGTTWAGSVLPDVN